MLAFVSEWIWRILRVVSPAPADAASLRTRSPRPLIYQESARLLPAALHSGSLCGHGDPAVNSNVELAMPRARQAQPSRQKTSARFERHSLRVGGPATDHRQS